MCNAIFDKFLSEYGNEIFEDLIDRAYLVVDENKKFNQVTAVINKTGAMSREISGTYKTVDGKIWHYLIACNPDVGTQLINFGNKPLKKEEKNFTYIFTPKALVYGNLSDEEKEIISRKFNCFKYDNWFLQKQREYNYDMYFSPSNEIRKHYELWLERKNLVAVKVEITD